MDELFKKQEKKSTVDIVIDGIWELLRTKKLQPGQKVPSESEISEGLGVSRGSVREAMKILSAFGIVEIRPGDGTYIPTKAGKPIIEPMLFSFMLYDPDLKELTEFRKMIEVDVVELVILNREKNQRERGLLEENMARFNELRRSADSTPEEFARLDLEFHRILGQAAHNNMMSRIYEFVIDYFEESISNSHHKQTNGERTYKAHSQIIEGIRSNDPELARKAIYDSVDLWENFQYQARIIH
jgi:GntR family transcriptional repressor for pyruvate dehydrogenase complex